jgi:hypothetical protein
VLDDAELAVLAHPATADVGTLEDVLASLVAAAQAVRSNEATQADIITLAASVRAIGHIRNELAGRGHEADRLAGQAATLVQSIAASAAARKTAGGLPRISTLARKAPARTRPMIAATTPGTLTASAFGQTIDPAQAAEIVAEGVRR